MIDIAELVKLAEKATLGPWYLELGEHQNHYVKSKSNPVWLICETYTYPESHVEPANADFIAAANPQTILALCEEIKSLRECKREALELAEFCKNEYELINEKNHKQMTGWQNTQAFLAKYKERE